MTIQPILALSLQRQHESNTPPTQPQVLTFVFPQPLSHYAMVTVLL
jgi:hypothetical protein